MLTAHAEVYSLMLNVMYLLQWWDAAIYTFPAGWVHKGVEQASKWMRRCLTPVSNGCIDSSRVETLSVRKRKGRWCVLFLYQIAVLILGVSKYCGCSKGRWCVLFLCRLAILIPHISTPWAHNVGRGMRMDVCCCAVFLRRKSFDSAHVESLEFHRRNRSGCWC